jgi:hypothetical protein
LTASQLGGPQGREQDADGLPQEEWRLVIAAVLPQLGNSAVAESVVFFFFLP